MEVIAVCPGCTNSMVFRDRSGERGAPLAADCATCLASYVLWGGRMTQVAGDGASFVDEPETAPRWDIA